MPAINLPASFRLQWHDAVDWDPTDLPQESILYLLVNGLNQSFNDVAATTPAGVLAKAAKARAKEIGRTLTKAETDDLKESLAAEIESAVAAAIKKRHDALIRGELAYTVAGGPRGSRLSPKVAAFRQWAEADARGIVASRGHVWPKDAAKAKELIEVILRRNAAEYEDRWANRADTTDDTADLLGLD